MRDLDDQVFRLRLQNSMGQTEAGHKIRPLAPGAGARQDGAAREGRQGLAMAKAEIIGKVVSNKMAKSVVVTIERQVRHGVYGKLQRLTSRFMAHDEDDEAKVGDRVALVPSRPLSRRKRWVVTRIVERAKEI